MKDVVKFEIQAYKKPSDIDALKDSHVPFSGSPRKHPYDPEIIILLVDPYSTHTFYYEFKRDDISFVEELPSITNMANEAIANVRVWVKKKAVAVKCSPFLVDAL